MPVGGYQPSFYVLSFPLQKIAFFKQKRPEVNNYDNDIARYIDRKAYSTAFRSLTDQSAYKI